jgi:DHA1 family tetracycline resistance protein-like MFS transporter
MRPRHAATPFILLTVLLDALAIGVVVPVLPKLIGSVMGDAADTAWGFGAMQLGFALAQFFSAPILGALADRHGRRPVLLTGMLSMGASFIAAALTDQYWVLLLFRTLSGAACANIAVANAYVSDITKPDDMARQFGLLSAMFGLGFILGPALGGLLGDQHLRWPFFLAGGLTLANFVYGWLVLPESLPVDKRQPMRLVSPFTAMAYLRQLRGVAPLLWVLAAASLVQAAIETYWMLYTEFRFGWTPGDNGRSLLALGVCAVIAQGVLMRPVQSILSARAMVIWGLASFVACLVGWGLATESWIMYALSAANVLGYLLYPSVQSLIAAKVDQGQHGQSMGALSSIVSVTAVIGPALAAPLMALVTSWPKTSWQVGLPFFASAAILCVAATVSVPPLLRPRDPGADG